MKIRWIEIEHFKRFEHARLDLTDPETGRALDRVLLLGDNGSGKSTFLQVTAALLGVATGRLSSVRDLAWPGFDFDLANRGWDRPASIRLEVELSEEEWRATERCYRELRQKERLTPPLDRDTVSLRLEGDGVYADSVAEFNELQGRHWARLVFRQLPEGRQIFEQLGWVFWYHEHRSATSVNLDRTADGTNSSGTHEASAGPAKEVTVDELRRVLERLHNFSARVRRGEYSPGPSDRDIYGELERSYGKVFPHRRLEGPVPRDEPGELLADSWFFLSEDGRRYELAEMSGGERALFPMLLDFANWSLHHSVVLIDELELHLHPPLQQLLLRALPKLGRHNQFLMTTHSDAVAAMVPEFQIRRLPEDAEPKSSPKAAGSQG